MGKFTVNVLGKASTAKVVDAKDAAEAAKVYATSADTLGWTGKVAVVAGTRFNGEVKLTKKTEEGETPASFFTVVAAGEVPCSVTITEGDNLSVRKTRSAGGITADQVSDIVAKAVAAALAAQNATK